MDQQQTSGRDEVSTGSSMQQHQQPQSPRSSSTDDTWGIGSSSALDRLRERDYRGRRSRDEGRPSSE